MVFDPARGEVVLFGGKSDSPSAEILGDTWVWDGVDWTKKSPANSPTPRFSTVMAFDGASGQSVLFGGSDGIFRLNQTWVWNGNNWTQKSPTTVPPRRVTAGMTFDPTSGGIMMFGGFGGVAPGDQKYLDDTWTWDGSNWILKSPATKPSGRFGFQMAFDPAIGRTVLFGGATSASGMNDTWTWDGSDWKLLTPGTSPASNAGGSMAFDPSSGSMVLFSGRGNSTWLFRLEVSPPTAQITTPADSQTYTVGEVVATDFNCEEAVGGPGVANCEDSNGSSNPAGTLDTSALGPQTYTVTATSENGLTGTAEIGYTVEQAEPTVAASGAEAEVQIGSSLKVDADLADAYQPSGSFIYRVYGPDDTTCSATPAFESSPVTVNDNGLYPGPNFTPTEPGTYRWIITYSGDTNNQAAASDCGANGSTSTITEDPPAPPPPPPTYECPAARPGLKVTGFGLKAPFGNAPPVFGVRVALRSNNAIVKIKPSMTYRLAGKNRTVKLKARTLEVNGRRQLRFRAPKQLKKNFRKAGVSIRRAPVTFKLKAQIRPQGSKAECFRKLRTSKLKTRLVEVSSRVALKRLGGR